MTGRRRWHPSLSIDDAAITAALTFHNDRKRKNGETRVRVLSCGWDLCGLMWDMIWETYCRSDFNTNAAVVAPSFKHTNYDFGRLLRREGGGACMDACALTVG